MTIYGMPPDDPSSLIPENTIDVDSRGAFEQHDEGEHDERLIDENDEVSETDETEQPDD